ncbi:MAG: endo-alpha-N-acetylgalactosaminidase family protein, partial [Propionibacteriales bacterium]|nr:endo-alpha-N-acetylgalactosaminidase family protein [Propionibacteriales bacterium]
PRPSRPAQAQGARNRTAHLLGTALLAGTVMFAAPQFTAPPSAVAAPMVASTQTISSAGLRVEVADDFPQIVSYTLADGGRFSGQPVALDTITINGRDRRVSVEGQQVSGDTATWTLGSPDLPGMSITAVIRINGSTAEFKITKIIDGTELVRTIGIADHSLLSVGSTDAGASVRSAIIDVSRNRDGDTTTAVTKDTPVDDRAVGSSYAVANTDRVAAAIESNSLYDNSDTTGKMDRNRILRRTTAEAGGAKRLGLWSGDWLYRTADSDTTLELPWAKVALTADANDDDLIDWQDGAIAMRGIGVETPRGEETPDRVITHIPFNIVSEATNPFLKTLDDIKRISLATDGLGQAAMLKGYQSEGHDSAHPDYGGNYNTRAGGLADLKKLADGSQQYNAELGVHINATEANPEANAWNDRLMDPKRPNWNWVDQAYFINQRIDRQDGTLGRRLAQLKAETGDALDFIYVDVYYEYGWLSESLQSELIKNDWRVTTEWASRMERTSTWSHWANDEKYGGSDNKGINSQLIRFVRNSEKDVWNPHPLLGTAHLVEFEGWTGQKDYRAFTRNVWQNNLPVKYLQQGRIIRWTDGRIDFDNGVSVAGTSAADRVISADGKPVAKGDSYLLPWTSAGARDPQAADKAYHWSATGGTSTWDVPKDLAKYRSFTVYELTDTGRKEVSRVTAKSGRITLDAKPGTPYVVYPLKASRQADPRWGEGTGIVDPGFNAGNLSAWNPTGGATAGTTSEGNNVARLGTDASAISQRTQTLKPGSYEATVLAEIEPGKRRELTVSAAPAGGTPATRMITASTAKNYVAASAYNNTWTQRVTVPFTVTTAGRVELKVSAVAGAAAITLDDVRLVAAPARPDDPRVLVDEDFEGDQPGWGPFVKGDAGGITDARTHRSERNEPYTQKGWNGVPIDDVISGDWSLKSNKENKGLVYRTVPQTADLKAGRRYRVSFNNQSAIAGAYQFVVGRDSTLTGKPVSTEVTRTDLPARTSTQRFTAEVDGSACGDTWVGLRRTAVAGNALFTLDDVTITDIGAAAAVEACANLEVSTDPQKLFPGQESVATTTLTSTEAEPISDVVVQVQAPDGFTVAAEQPNAVDQLAPGGILATRWTVQTPADISDEEVTFTVRATYKRTDGSSASVTRERVIGIVPPPPRGTVFASDHAPMSANNGWGPMELDRSNGGQDAGDGGPLTIDGITYDKGLGTHAPAEVTYFTGGRCSRFTAVVGIDDAQVARGTVQFQVQADGRSVVTSPVLTATSAGWQLTADVAGADQVKLVADPTSDGNGNDHADWGDAQFVCQ